MKRVLVLIFALVCANQLMAAEEGINSKVIHNYTQFGIGYGFADDVGGGTAHGVLADTSVDMDNLLFGVSGGYFWGKGDLEFWGVSAGVGYVVRLMRNHVNIIPQFSMGYDKAEVGDAHDSVTSIQPGITLSYAINNRLSLSANYAYVRALDNNEEDGHVFGPGVRIAVAENIGINLGANFTDEGQAFLSAFAGVSFHF